MKKMCRNPICNTDFQQKTANTPFSTNSSVNTIADDTAGSNCSPCVLNQIGIAQAYIPSQKYSPPMPQEQNLLCGTVFSELIIPYCSGWNLYRFRKEA